MKFSRILYTSTALTVLASSCFNVFSAEELKIDAQSSVKGVALKALQEFESERCCVDFHDYPQFKSLTHEIGEMLGSFQEGGVLPKGEELDDWVDSIIYTRHKFSGQACLGVHGMIHRYINNIRNLDDFEYRNYIAVIMAIDAMTKLALADENFADLWLKQGANNDISEEFVTHVLNSLKDDQFGWPHKKQATSPSSYSFSQSFKSASLAGKIKEIREPSKSSVSVTTVVEEIQVCHHQRCEVFNIPLNETIINGEVHSTKGNIRKHTMSINSILRDKTRVDEKRHATDEEKKIILQAVMGAEIIAHAQHQQPLHLSPQLPCVRKDEALFKHFEILRLTEELSRNFVQQIRDEGYEHLSFLTINEEYKDLFGYSGLHTELFLDWFKEVFEEHKEGFVYATKLFEVEDLTKSVQAVLVRRPDIVRLAGDIFHLYAPKLDLQTVYVEIMASGGEWRGWNVEHIDSFAHVVNLTEEEKRANPERVQEYLYLNEQNEVSLARIQTSPSLETVLRTEFKESLARNRHELYSTSTKGRLISEEDSRIQVKYIYDHCLSYRGLGVVGKGQVAFKLTRTIKPELKHLAVKKETLLPDYIAELYASLLAEPSQEMYDFWYKRGMVHQMFVYGCALFMRKQPLSSLEVFKEAINLGNKEAKTIVPHVLNIWGEILTLTKKDSEVSFQQAIEYFKEAASLKNERAKKNLILCAKLLTQDEGVARNIPQALELLYEHASVSDFDMIRDFNSMTLDRYIAAYLEEREGISSHDYSKRIMHVYSNHISSLFSLCGESYLNGTDGVEKNIEKAIECFQKAKIFCHLEYLKGALLFENSYHREILESLNRRLIGCARELIFGKKCIKDEQRALIILNELVEDASDMKAEVARELNNYGTIFLIGCDTDQLAQDVYEITGAKKNINQAIEFFQKAASLGNEDACKNLMSCAEILMVGQDVTRDMPQAIAILRNLARSDLYINEVVLLLNEGGEFFSKGGNGIEKDTEIARMCLEEAAELGDL